MRIQTCTADMGVGVLEGADVGIKEGPVVGLCGVGIGVRDRAGTRTGFGIRSRISGGKAYKEGYMNRALVDLW